MHEFIDRADHNFGGRIYSQNIKNDTLRTRKGKLYNLLSIPFYLVHKIDDYITWYLKLNNSLSYIK